MFMAIDIFLFMKISKKELIEQEIFFFKGDYTSSLKVSVDTIKLVDDNFERKLLAYEKE